MTYTIDTCSPPPTNFSPKNWPFNTFNIHLRRYYSTEGIIQLHTHAGQMDKQHDLLNALLCIPEPARPGCTSDVLYSYTA